MKSAVSKIVFTIVFVFLVGQMSPGWSVPIHEREAEIDPVIEVFRPDPLFVGVDIQAQNIDDKDKNKHKPGPVGPDLQESGIKELIKQLESPMFEEVELAKKKLIEMGKKAAPVLVEMILDEKVGRIAVIILCEIGKPAIPALIDALNKEDFRLRYRAADILGVFGDKKAVYPII